MRMFLYAQRIRRTVGLPPLPYMGADLRDDPPHCGFAQIGMHGQAHDVPGHGIPYREVGCCVCNGGLAVEGDGVVHGSGYWSGLMVGAGLRASRRSSRVRSRAVPAQRRARRAPGRGRGASRRQSPQRDEPQDGADARGRVDVGDPAGPSGPV